MRDASHGMGASPVRRSHKRMGGAPMPRPELMNVAANESVDARQLVDQLIADALRRCASDIHVDPSATSCEVKFRIDGLLQPIATHPPDVGRMLVTRLMVMAKLL